MSICGHCGGEMQEQISCTDEPIVIDNRAFARIRYGDERYPRRCRPPANCGDCFSPLGGVHHPGCDMECCPMCMGQALMCGHFDDTEGDEYDDAYEGESDEPGNVRTLRARHCKSHLFRQAGGGRRSDR